MSEIKVRTPELAVAASGIGRLVDDVGEAQGAIGSARGQAGSFGGGDIESAFLDMCAQAERAAGEYSRTVSELARNVAMASLGYVTTDEGVIPVSTLGEAGRNP